MSNAMKIKKPGKNVFGMFAIWIKRKEKEEEMGSKIDGGKFNIP